MQNEKIKALTVIEQLYDVGIKIVPCKVSIISGEFWVSYFDGGCTFSIYGKDWHRTPEAAIARAEEMRAEKIASLKKQIERLMKLEFKV